MTIIQSKLHGVRLIIQDVHEDERGTVMQPFSLLHHNYHQNWQLVHTLVVWNKPGGLRGLHWQFPAAQTKLVHCVRGVIWDVVVDLRQSSPTFGQCEVFRLVHDRTLFIPEGFAHGYRVTSDLDCIVCYTMAGDTEVSHQRTVNLFDPHFGLEWGGWKAGFYASDRDRNAPLLKDIPKEHLFP